VSVARNPYAPPAVTDTVPAATIPRPEQEWFAVGTSKLLVMCVTTWGVYAVYWFAKQFHYQSRAHWEPMRPFFRALFSVFYARQLFRRVEVAAGKAGVAYDWRTGSLATVYILSTLMHGVMDRADAGPLTHARVLTTVVLVLGVTYPLFRVQSTMNDLLDRTDPQRDRNEKYTVWNWPVMIAGALLLVLTAVAPLLQQQ
jgi:hypothetical protein